MNKASLVFDARIGNEPFARCVVAGFVAGLNPTLDELTEIKTIVSEAVANAIIHGYENRMGQVILEMILEDRTLTLKVTDHGCGIADVAQALTPLYTTKAHLERSGMGMTIMDSLADEFHVVSSIGVGTTVTIVKTIKESGIHESDH